MSEQQETVADIVREMLDYDGDIEEFATRIEVAHKREMARVEGCLQGNCERFVLGAEPCTNCKLYKQSEELSNLRREKERLMRENSVLCDARNKFAQELREIKWGKKEAK